MQFARGGIRQPEPAQRSRSWPPPPLIQFMPEGGPQPLRQRPPGTPWQLHLWRENPARLCPADINPYSAALSLFPFHHFASPSRKEEWKCGDAAPRAGDATLPASATLPAGAAVWPQPESGGFRRGSPWRVLHQPDPLHGSCGEPN